LDEPDQLGGRRHVAVLETDPRQDVVGTLRGQLDDPLAVGDRRAQRLLDEHVQVGGQRVAEDVDVGVVRRHDHDGVTPFARQQPLVTVERDGVAARGGDTGVP
jgi:hypothetical protein